MMTAIPTEIIPDLARPSFQDFTNDAPQAFAALRTLGKTAEESGLDKTLLEVVMLRVSQINGCAFCIRIHQNFAREFGVEAVKLDLVAGWRDAGVFTARETTALAWAERLTDIAGQGAPDHAYAALRAQFSESEALFLTIAVSTINIWNRLAVAMRFAPPPAWTAA